VPVTDSYRDFVIEQLEQCTRNVRAKRMFGAVGIYAGETFFAVIDSDRLYFRVDDQTRPTYQAAGMGPAPLGDGRVMAGYYEVPLAALEAPDELRTWVTEAIAAAQRVAARKTRRRSPPRDPSTR
jgi:DNA transformation protein